MSQIKPSKLLLILYCLVLAVGVNGREPKKKNIQQSVLQAELMDQHVSELMADKVNTIRPVTSEALAELEYISEDDLLEAEALRFPADELYDSNWDTCWVNPFRSKEVNFPDSFDVDCRSFTIPIDSEIKVTSKYGPRRRRMHRGIDLKVQVGDTIRSAFSGKVRIKGFERRGYGYYLVIRHPNGLETIYGHLSKFLVTENDIVKTGQAIALGGNTGRSTGAHLHFETRFLGQALNPSDIIDFEKGVPHQDFYALHKSKIGRTNTYTSTSERIVYHRVKRGETLGKIAQKYGTSVNELCRLNGLTRKSTLRIGQSIRCGTTSVRTVKKETETLAATPTVTKAVEEKTAEETVQRQAAYHKVKSRETLSSIARQYGTTVNALCRLNDIQSTTPLRVGQRICYRAGSKQVVAKKEEQQDEQAVNVATTETQTSQEITSKQGGEQENVKQQVTPPAAKSVYHRVAKGETLSKIARQYGTSIDELCRLNGISKNAALRIGQKLRCNADEQAIARAEKTVTSSSDKSKQDNVKKTVYYRVKKGDTLGVIARKHGVTVQQLCEMNNITKTTILRVGRSLRCS